MTENEQYPVIIGVGQVVDRWNGVEAESAPNPLDMIRTCIEKAIEDASGTAIAEAIDCAAFVRTFPDSLAEPITPFGKINNLPQAVLSGTDLKPREVIYSAVGGEQPQALVNEFAARLAAGEIEVGLIAGGEVTGALKSAMKNRLKLDWSNETDGPIDNRRGEEQLLSSYEISNGLGMPPQTYAAFEQAWRARNKLTLLEYRSLVGEIFAELSKVAESNPYAQFPKSHDAGFLSQISKENYPICDPLLKWHVAQDAVNQSAALIITTVAKARELGVDPERWIYLHGHSEIKDTLVSDRPDLSRSDSIELALAQALKDSGLTAADIAHRDIYSCFPVVVLLAAEYLGMNPKSESLTVTGGLPFFGGPGNNYSTHAIASMVDRLRVDNTAYGLVLANGGFISKEAVGVYSALEPISWSPCSNYEAQMTIDERKSPGEAESDCDAVIEAYCVKHGRHGPVAAYVIARNDSGRIIANIESDHRSTMKALSLCEQGVGQAVYIESRAGRNFLVNSNLLSEENSGRFLDRDFEYVTLLRRGHVLEVTLNLVASHNALFSAAHFELAEIFDAFERDRDLWVAIITGAGDKAFCSGNDLKVTATGGDMSTPKSGFAGLCARLNRTKPVIAAVNGVAMGGGLEIVLACDLAVASEQAKFALPEVKVGLFAAAGGLQRLMRQVGEKVAMELILTGRSVQADEARRIGLVNSVVPHHEVITAARDLAESIADNSPSSISASKRVLNAIDEQGDWAAALALSAGEIRNLLRTKDSKEGVRAFVEKRKPKWLNQ